jgi:hypothetical protein
LSRAGSSAPVSRAGRPDPVTRQPRVWCRSLPDRSPGLGRVGLSRRPPRAWRRVQRSRDDGEPVTLRDPVGSRGDPRAVSTNSIPTGAASSTARSSSTGRRPTSMDEVTTPFATRSHLITLLNLCRRESIRPGVSDGHLRCPLRLTAAIGAAVPARRDSAAAPTTPPTHVHRPKASWPKTTANPAASSISANQTTYR